ncbi:MAG: F0F1 ATP synthase subunit A [Coriobacteriales bacterium]|nr:F0F1 ATP synthase subunit A [Coriobacteriales bacterium]
MGPLDELGHHIEELLKDLGGMDMFNFGWGSITTYSVWIIIALVVCLVVFLVVKSRMRLVPKMGPVAAIEATVDYIRKDIGHGVLGSKEAVDRHMPFIFTVFFFILGANLIGLIPGAKAASGTFSATLVLALISFIYFNYYGIKHSGVLHYVKNIAPAGIMPGLNIAVWLIELMSLCLRLVTLSVRLFANMYAGHIVLGAFSILTTLFVFPVINEFTLANLAQGSVSIAWMVLLIAMYAMELLVAFIQAYVFSLLSAVYVMLATSEH